MMRTAMTTAVDSWQDRHIWAVQMFFLPKSLHLNLQFIKKQGSAIN